MPFSTSEPLRSCRRASKVTPGSLAWRQRPLHHPVTPLPRPHTLSQVDGTLVAQSEGGCSCQGLLAKSDWDREGERKSSCVSVSPKNLNIAIKKLIMETMKLCFHEQKNEAGNRQRQIKTVEKVSTGPMFPKSTNQSRRSHLEGHRKQNTSCISTIYIYIFLG